MGINDESIGPQHLWRDVGRSAAAAPDLTRALHAIGAAAAHRINIKARGQAHWGTIEHYDSHVTFETSDGRTGSEPAYNAVECEQAEATIVALFLETGVTDWEVIGRRMSRDELVKAISGRLGASATSDDYVRLDVGSAEALEGWLAWLDAAAASEANETVPCPECGCDSACAQPRECPHDRICHTNGAATDVCLDCGRVWGMIEGDYETPVRCVHCGEADRTKGDHGLGRCVWIGQNATHVELWDE